jgi:leucyl aminopeptidase
VVVEHSEQVPAELDVDLLCLGLFEGGELPDAFADAPGAEDARGGRGELTLLRPDRPARVLVVGLGGAEAFDAEGARVAAARATRQARRLEAESIGWLVPAGAGIAPGIVEGTVLAGFRADRLKADRDEERPELERLVLAGAADRDETAAALVVAEATNRARELQELPANIADPAYLVDRALEIASHEDVEAEILDRERLLEEGFGGLLAVAAGSASEPALIVLRYRGGEGERLGLVGKGVTFDSGGISIKPASGMQAMKMDMSGGAAVLEATAAIAELGLPIDLVSAVPVVENLPSGTATRPGDVITQLNGKTVEVNNTDAEGRLILADALTWCVRREGAERLVDIATLTGAAVVALGTTHAALIGTDDELAAVLEAAGTETGELLWRLPLHEEYRRLMDGTVADLTNASPKRHAGSITAAAFLSEFVDGVPWAHIDIAGTASEVGREYVGKGASGFGVRLLVAAARALAVPTVDD